MMTDPIADMLTRVRNATAARKASVDVPWSRHKEEIARVLVQEGYLGAAATIEAEPRRVLRIDLRYDNQRRPVITGIRRVSRPSLRVYVGMDVHRAARIGAHDRAPRSLAGLQARHARAGGVELERQPARVGLNHKGVPRRAR